MSVTEASVEAATLELQEMIPQHDLLIFSAPVGPQANKTCPYVAKTIATLDAAGVGYHHQIVGIKGTNSRTALIELCHGVGTVPQAFCLGMWIGGYDASDGLKSCDGVCPPGIMPLFENGKLQAALEAREELDIRWTLM